MYFLNPTIFLYKDTLYSLVRKETNVKRWEISLLSYELNKLDINLTKIKTYPCSFQIESVHFNNILRKDIKYPYYGIEDIKYAFQKNNKIFGICNVLTQQKPFRIFRVGIIQIDIENQKIILIKLLKKPNMNIHEKNWTIYMYKNKKYIITNLLPFLEVYELSDNYDLNLVYKKKSIHNYNFLLHRLHTNYKNLILTCCQSLVEINNDLFLIILKKRVNNNYYEYYLGYFNPKLFELYISKNKWDNGHLKYLNSFQKIKNKYYTCFGIRDQEYKINNVSIPLENKNNLKRII